MAELLTPKQKERRTRDVCLASEFNRMRIEYPTASDSLIMKDMASRKVYGVGSYAAVRLALIRTGHLTPQKQ